MTSDAPENLTKTALPYRIMVWQSAPALSHTGTWATTRYPEEAKAYIPEGYALAMMAAEREACAEIATIEAENFAYVAGKDWRSPGSPHDRGRQECGYKISSTIRAQTDADAQAALERRDARIRNEALAQAWTIADQNGAVETASALQRLITEDQSDE